MKRMVWDGAKLTELVAEESRLKNLLADVSTKCNEMQDSDAAWEDGRLATYSALEMQHGQVTRELGTIRNELNDMRLLEPSAAKRAHKSAVGRFLRSGLDGLEDAEIEAAKPQEGEKSNMPISRAGESFMIRAATASDATSGQEAVEEDIQPRVIDALNAYGGVAKMAQQFMTGAGGEWRYIQEDAANQKGEFLDAQNTAVSAQDINNLGVVTFSSKTVSSKSIGLTLEMIQDAVFDIQTYIERQAVRRLGRAWNEAFTTTLTSLTGGPLGVVSTATAGISAQSATAVTAEELSDLSSLRSTAPTSTVRRDGRGRAHGRDGRPDRLHDLPRHGEVAPQAQGLGQPAPVASLDPRGCRATMIYGRPYAINYDMDDVATGNVPLIFGNFSYYGIRNIRSIEIYRFLDSRTMQNYAVECLAFSRRDGRPIGVVDGSGICEAWAKLTMG